MATTTSLPPFDVLRVATTPSGSAWLVQVIPYLDVTALRYVRDRIQPRVNGLAKHVYAAHVVVALLAQLPDDIALSFSSMDLLRHDTGAIVLEWALCLCSDYAIQTTLAALRKYLKLVACTRRGRSVLWFACQRADFSAELKTHLLQLVFGHHGAGLVADLVAAGVPGVFDMVLQQQQTTLVQWANDRIASMVINACLREPARGSLMVHKLAVDQHCLTSKFGLATKQTLYEVASPCAMRILVSSERGVVPLGRGVD